MKLVENITYAIMSPSSKPRWSCLGRLYGGALKDHQAQSRYPTETCGHCGFTGEFRTYACPSCGTTGDGGL